MLLILGACSQPSDTSENSPKPTAQPVQPQPKQPEKYDVVGDWISDIPAPKANEIRRQGLALPYFEFVFKRDGTFTMSMTYGDTHRRAEGTYTLDGIRLTTQATVVDGKKLAKPEAPEVHTLIKNGKYIATATGQRLVRKQ